MIDSIVGFGFTYIWTWIPSLILSYSFWKLSSYHTSILFLKPVNLYIYYMSIILFIYSKIKQQPFISITIKVSLRKFLSLLFLVNIMLKDYQKQKTKKKQGLLFSLLFTYLFIMVIKKVKLYKVSCLIIHSAFCSVFLRQWAFLVFYVIQL